MTKASDFNKLRPLSLFFRSKAALSWSLFLLLICAWQAPAQSDDDSRTEFFAGYSALAINFETNIPNPPMPVVTSFDGTQTFHGFNVSGTRYLTKRFGFTGGFSMHFKGDSIPDPLGSGNITTDTRIYNIAAGPQYKFRNSSRVAPFVHALAGVAITTSTIKVPSLSVSDTSSSTDFAMLLGGGVDVRVNKRVDLRVLQVDYNPIFTGRGNTFGFGASTTKNVRFSFGIVFR